MSQLGISISTLYAYVNGEGQAKLRAQKRSAAEPHSMPVSFLTAEQERR